MFIIRVFFELEQVHQSQALELLEKVREAAFNHGGCLHFAVFSEPQNEQRFMLYEEWENQSFFEAYKNSEVFKTTAPQLFTLMKNPPNSAYFQAEILGL